MQHRFGMFRVPQGHQGFIHNLQSSTSELHNQQLSVMFNCSICIIVYLNIFDLTCLAGMFQGSLSLDDWISEAANDSICCVKMKQLLPLYHSWQWQRGCASRMSVWQSFQNSLAHLCLKMGEPMLPQFQWTIRIFPMTWPLRGKKMVCPCMPQFQIQKMDRCHSWLPIPQATKLSHRHLWIKVLVSARSNGMLQDLTVRFWAAWRLGKARLEAP